MTQIPYALVDDTIPYSPHLGWLLGCCAALILQQTYYWCQKNKEKGRNFRDGFHWTYNTYKEWEANLRGFDERTIRRNINMLAERKLLVIGRYNTRAYDKTNWYRVDLPAVRLLMDANPLPQPTGQSGQTDWPICPHGLANLATPIPETYSETYPETSLAAPEPPNPLTVNPGEPMLPKNQLKKGPTSSASVVADVLAPPSVKKDTMVMGLYKVWAVHVPRHHEEVKFVGEFNMKQKGLMAQCGRLWKDRADAVLLFVIENWTKFGKYVTAQAGTKSFPASPHLEFLVKHKELAINFFLNKEEAKDSGLQLTANPPALPGVKKFGKVTLKTGGNPDHHPALVPDPVPAAELPKPAPVEDEEDAPLTLEFLLSHKF